MSGEQEMSSEVFNDVDNMRSPLLTVKEVAAILRCSEGHVRNLIKDPSTCLHWTRVSGRRMFVTKDNLMRFIMEVSNEQYPAGNSI